MVDFVNLAATAERLINENGRPLVLKRGTAPGDDYDPVTGEPTAPTPGGSTEFPIRAVVLSMTTGYAMKVGQENVHARDRLLLMGPAVQPLEQDVISFDGEDWNVVRVEETAPNGLPLTYTCQVRP